MCGLTTGLRAPNEMVSIRAKKKASRMSKENSYCVKKEVHINTKCENSGRNVLRQDYQYCGGSIKFTPG